MNNISIQMIIFAVVIEFKTHSEIVLWCKYNKNIYGYNKKSKKNNVQVRNYTKVGVTCKSVWLKHRFS